MVITVMEIVITVEAQLLRIPMRVQMTNMAVDAIMTPTENRQRRMEDTLQTSIHREIIPR
jgi:hypothetical protein